MLVKAPRRIEVSPDRKRLLLFWEDEALAIQAACLRVYSPSAEVQQHGAWRAVRIKDSLNIYSLRLVGQYALQIVFNDGHDSGLYTWAHLRQLAQQEALLWQQYQDAIKESP